MQILVSGLLPFDSGKTTIAEALVREAVSYGWDVGVSKPVTSLNGWYQYESIKRSIKFGFLVGEDMYRLYQAAKSNDPLYKVGSIVSLLLPPDPQRVSWNTSFYSGYASHNQISVLRISGKNKTKHYFVPANIRKATKPLREEVELLLQTLKPEPIDAEGVEKLLFNSRNLADECLEEVNLNHDLVVVESYSNVASPTTKSLYSDLILVVAPGKVAIFEGEEYRKALTVVAEIKEPWHITTEDVLPLLNPIDTVDIRPGKVKGIFEVVEGLLKTRYGR